MPSTSPTAAAAGTFTLGDLTVNRMGLGSMRLTVRADVDQALAVLRSALDLGVNHVDTAAFYRSPAGILDGEPGPVRYATELIRDAFGPDDDVVVTTKVGPGITDDGEFYQATSADQLRRQVEENLRRLGRECLDVVNLRIIKKQGHDSVAERFEALAGLREEGLIRHLGLSNVRVDHLDEAEAIAPVVCVQNAYAVDKRDDADLLRVCGERGIAFVPFFALTGQRREAGPVTEHSEPVSDVARKHGVTEQQVRLTWTLHQGAHVLAIPGTGSVAHLAENVAAAALDLDDDDLALLG
ncbi:MAG TPA: aldo/keto reductase [Angustibacter sp.]|nr:aldo/keto reductase [Angustibacter sp.]